MFMIVKKERLTPLVYRMEVEAPRVAESALPGQFLIVRTEEKGERVPLTISDYDPGRGTVTIVTQEIGASTKDICSFEEGQSFADVVGPLGMPSEFVGKTPEQLAGQRYVFIAGGCHYRSQDIISADLQGGDGYVLRQPVYLYG